MTKGQFIKALQELPCGDEVEVRIFDHLKNLNEGGGEPTSAGIYADIDIDILHHNLTDDEKEYYMDVHDYIPKPIIALIFTNPDEPNPLADEGPQL
ncbi:hypothetical protein [Mucilaginibacter sp.]|uniref:hypothetical protein n=1 Tax=Mucilaginibacter sp. TaxID=1882438 RepID=UPI00326633E4